MTLDAMGCQTAIAERILARGGDYLLALKANHPLAHAAVVEHFDEHCFRRGAPGRASCDAFDDSHGRLVRRRVFASTKAAALEALSAWPGLRTVLAVETIRSVNGTGKVESEIRYFLSSGAMTRPSSARRSAGTGRSRTRCIGCWTSPSVRTTAACGIAGPRAIWRSCARSRSTYWPRPVNQGQHARQAEEGRLERRLHVPTPGRKRAAQGRAGMIFMRRP